MISTRIIDQVVTPRLRQGEFIGWFDAGMNQILARLKGKVLPAVSERQDLSNFILKNTPMLVRPHSYLSRLVCEIQASPATTAMHPGPRIVVWTGSPERP